MKKNINIAVGVLLILMVALNLYSVPVFAACTGTEGKICNPLGGATTIEEVLNIVLVGVQYIAGVLSVIYIILAGLKFVLAKGDPGEIKKARSMLLYVVIGVAIIFGAQGIMYIVTNTIKEVGGGGI